MSELGNNIRRIAKTEDLQRQINDLLSQVATLKDKDAKLGDRSTAYQKNSGGGVGQSSGDKLAEQVAEVVGGALDDFSDGLLDSFSDAAGNADGTGDDGSSNLLSAFSQDLDDMKTTAPNIGTQIKKLEGLHEIGGSKEANIQLDGQFEPPFYPDSGFTNYNADTDPREENFVAGTWYSTSGGYFASSPWQSAQSYLTTILDPLDPSNAPHTVVSVNAYNPATDSTVNVVVSRASAANFEQTVNINTTGCTIGVDAWCPTEQPIGAWEPDSIHQLAFDGAKFITNSAEAAADYLNSWGDSPSNISGETSSGEGVNIIPTDQGGTVITYDNGNQILVNKQGLITATNY